MYLREYQTIEESKVEGFITVVYSSIYFGGAGLSPRSSCFATTGDANASRAGNHGFLSIGAGLKSYNQQLKQLFNTERLPSYSTIRRALLNLDYEDYSQRLSKFFEIEPIEGETLALDGKVLKGSDLISDENLHCEPHKAITLVSAYLVERELILKPEEVENKSNEINAVPKLIKALALNGVVVAFDAMNTQKNS